MRVLQVLLSPRIGGAESLASALEGEWRRLGHGAEIVFIDESGDAPSSRLARLRRIRSAAARIAPDVVVAHSAIPAYYARLALRGSVATVVVLHSAVDDHARLKERLAERMMRRWTAAVVAVSGQQADRYRRHFPEAEVTLIPNGIRTDLPSRRSVRPRPREVLTLARVAEQKRPWFWSEVTAIAERASSGLRFRWVGPVGRFNRVDELVARHSDGSGSAVLAGPMSDPVRALEEADILFHPSAREAASIALIEAMASGLPVVCASSVASGLPSSSPAIFFDPESPDSAATALTDVVRDWPAAGLRALEAAEAIRTDFSVEVCAGAYLNLFDRL